MSIGVTLAILQAAAAASPAVPTAVAPPDDAKVVCKTVNPTGSRVAGKRVCMTKAEWRRLSRESEEATRDIQDSYSKPAEGN